MLRFEQPPWRFFWKYGLATMLVAAGGWSASEELKLLALPRTTQSALRRLASYSGRRQGKLVLSARGDAQAVVWDLDDSLIGTCSIRDCYLWRMEDQSGVARIVFVALLPNGLHPGISFVSVRVIDPYGRVLATHVFGVGWRSFPNTASLSHIPGTREPVIAISAGPTWSGVDSRQYFAITGNEVVIVRVEDKGGAALRSVFYGYEFRFGPRVPQRTPQEWEAALSSGNTPEVLRTLVWLGGRHLDADKVISSARLVKRTLARAGVQRTLKDLANSPNAWIREQAMLAFKPDYYEYR